MILDLTKIFLKIKKSSDGIFYTNSNHSISYPSDGNELCMQVEESSFWFNHRNNIIAETIKNYNLEKVFLDIGGGNGFVSKRLQDDGFKVILIEPGKVGAQNSYSRGIQNVICSTLEETGLKKESIYSVGLFDVIEHIENDRQFLRNVNGYLKDGGYLYITVPSYKFLWSKEDDEAGHFKRYTLSKLKKLLQESGFKSEYSTYIFSLLPIPIFLLRVLPEKIGINLKNHGKEKVQNEHTLKNGILATLTQLLWNFELFMVRKKIRIPFGGSCFVVCKK